MRLGSIAMIPYFSPGDDKLADALGEIAEKHSGIIMKNHGPIVSGKTVESTVYGIEELEESYKLAFILHEKDAELLSTKQICELKDRYPQH